MREITESTVTMPMDSLEFKHLVAEFGRDLKEIGDRLYEALQGDLPPTEAEDAIAAARAKLMAFAELNQDPRLDDIKRQQVASTFGEEVEWIRERLSRT
jgi:hypothetical protein